MRCGYSINGPSLQGEVYYPVLAFTDGSGVPHRFLGQGFLRLQAGVRIAGADVGLDLLLSKGFVAHTDVPGPGCNSSVLLGVFGRFSEPANRGRARRFKYLVFLPRLCRTLMGGGTASSERSWTPSVNASYTRRATRHSIIIRSFALGIEAALSRALTPWASRMHGQSLPDKLRRLVCFLRALTTGTAVADGRCACYGRMQGFVSHDVNSLPHAHKTLFSIIDYIRRNALTG